VYFGVRSTVGGFLCGEVSSAMQKEIRRGNEREALFWATELDLSGYAAYVFRRLVVMASEDIGLAEPHLPATLAALQASWLDTKKREGARYNPMSSGGGLFLVHAVLLCVRAKKSRIADNACVVIYTDREKMKMEIPDYAVDHHTARGRDMGRTEATHGASSYHLENQGLDDPYLAESKTIDGWADQVAETEVESTFDKKPRRNGT
jgi:replication-associated recombination protein RarA